MQTERTEQIEIEQTIDDENENEPPIPPILIEKEKEESNFIIPPIEIETVNQSNKSTKKLASTVNKTTANKEIKKETTNNTTNSNKYDVFYKPGQDINTCYVANSAKRVSYFINVYFLLISILKYRLN